MVSVISLICSTYFFSLAHSGVMSWALAIGFELGAMACLLSTMIIPKHKLGLVWVMFIALTLFQCMGNMYAAFVSLEGYEEWVNMFGMQELDLIQQKRILAAISGIILPLVALGFIRIMADVMEEFVAEDTTQAVNSSFEFAPAGQFDDNLNTNQSQVSPPKEHQTIKNVTVKPKRTTPSSSHSDIG